jgi:hypothetical protein
MRREKCRHCSASSHRAAYALRRYLRESFPGCWIPYPGGTPCALTCFFHDVVGLPQGKNGSASRVLSHEFLLLAGPCFEVADIRCSGLQVCSPPRSFLPLRILLQGSRGFYVRAYRALLPPHAPDMLTVRIQVIDGTATFTLSDSQPCRLLTSLHRHYPVSSLLRSSPGASVLLASRLTPLVPLPLASPCRFSRSVQEPGCFAPPTCRMPLGPSQASPELIPEEGSPPGSDIA